MLRAIVAPSDASRKTPSPAPISIVVRYSITWRSTIDRCSGLSWGCSRSSGMLSYTMRRSSLMSSGTPASTRATMRCRGSSCRSAMVRRRS